MATTTTAAPTSSAITMNVADSLTTLCEARDYLQETFQPKNWLKHKETNCVYESVVDTLVKFPVLAKKKFEFGSTCVLPLSLLLLSKTQVDLAKIQKVYRLYPPSINSFGLYYKYSAGYHGKLSRPDYSYYPLYLACLESGQDDVIQFIASKLDDDHYDPECLAMFRRLFAISNGSEQKHLSLKTIKLLLSMYPDLTTVEYSGGKILDLAFQSGYSVDTLKYILQKTPDKTMAIRAPTALEKDKLLCLKEVLLPNMTQLVWVTHSLDGLQILRDCMTNNTTITKLILEIRTTSRDDQDTIIGDTLQAILSADHLHYLSIETTSTLDIQPFMREALQNNRSLHTLKLDPPISDLKPMNALLEILESYNTGLQSVSIDQRLHKYSSHKKILYYLSLNQCGRAKARNLHTPLQDFAQILQDTMQRHHDNKMYQFRLLYGLLRETPSLWCTSSHHHKNNNNNNDTEAMTMESMY